MSSTLESTRLLHVARGPSPSCRRERLRRGADLLDSFFEEGTSEDDSPPWDHARRSGSGFDSSPEDVGWQWADDHSEVSQCSYYDSGDEYSASPRRGHEDAEASDDGSEGSNSFIS